MFAESHRQAGNRKLRNQLSKGYDISRDLVGYLELHGLVNKNTHTQTHGQWNYEVTISNLAVITVAADGLVPSVAETSVGTMGAVFGPAVSDIGICNLVKLEFVLAVVSASVLENYFICVRIAMAADIWG